MSVKRITKTFWLAAIISGLALAMAAGNAAAQTPSAGQAASAPMPHQDHNPKHGGEFFMAMDDQHHLEGVFIKPDVFRVYLYDAYTKPLSKAQVKQASGTIQLGDDENAPKIPLSVSKDGKTLEVALPSVKFPFTITLLMRFPGMTPDARPELFTLPFSAYTNPNDHPANDMAGMKM